MKTLKESISGKLNKKEKQALTTALANLAKGVEYLKSDRVIMCHSNKSPNHFSYINKQGQGIDEMNKFIGSDLCYLYRALEALQQVI